MFDRFTDRARKVMGLSRQEAVRFNHDYIGTEHILLGLVLETSGVAADVLKNLEVDPKRVRQEVERLMTPGSAPVTKGQLPFTPRAKKVLEFSLEESLNLGHSYIGAEHLLLGLIREEEGIAARALKSLNVRIEDVREGILELLWGSSEEKTPVPELSGPLTDRARRVMRIAGDEAARFRHREIGTEHILLGLIGEVAPGVLSKILLRRLREETQKLMTPGTEPVAEGRLGFTTAARKVIDLALHETHDLGHGGAGPEHLLLGLIREKEGIAARVLSAAGITADEVLQVIRDTPRRSSWSVFDRFADRSRVVLGLARQEAQRFGHDYIGTEHVLLGLVAAGGRAVEVLKKLGIDPRHVRVETEKLITKGNTVVTMGQLPFTPSLKRALELALEEARGLGDDSIRTEHLFLGLAREAKGTAAQVLATLGVTCEVARRAIAGLGPPAPPE